MPELTDRLRHLAVLLLAVLALTLSFMLFTAGDEGEPNPYDDLVPDLEAAPDAEPVVVPEGDGAVPVIHRVPTDQPVAFITIDDGFVRSEAARQVIEAADIPVTVFPLSPEAEADPDYFAGLVEEGATLQSHSVNHHVMPDLAPEEQRREVCGSADALGELFDERPRLFRPPYGEYDDATLDAAAACGMTAVVHWTVTVDHGEVGYLPDAEGVRPGDVLLLHFRDDIADDLLASLEAIAAAGLTVGLLEDYLPE